MVFGLKYLAQVVRYHGSEFTEEIVNRYDIKSSQLKWNK